ncbi:uncharacterized protein (TIGR02118 family) [Bradyrhizobium liaoningense]
MIKLICLIQRPDDCGRAEFREWWLGHHATVAAKLPGLRKYTISITENRESVSYDGVAELWFDDVQAMEAAFASPQGQECAREDVDLIGHRVAFVTHEHEIL